jgi:uncharacterized protein YcfJ
MKVTKFLLPLLLVPSFAFGMAAQVVQSTPVFQTYSISENRCQAQVVETPGSGVGTLIGVVVGAAIGNEIIYGIGGSAVNAVLGGIVGGIVGNQLSSSEKIINNCYPEHRTEVRLIGYDVRFRVNGHEFVQRMSYDPGVGTIHTVTVNVR